MIKAMLFDLDGTVLDTNELIIQSFLHALEGQTPVPYTRELLIPHMGRPLYEQMRYFTEQDEVEEIVKTYRAFNVAKHDELVSAFPHVEETLAALKEAGIRIGIVTSKVRMTTEMGLKLTGLDKYVDTVITVDDVKQPKPHPEGIQSALRNLDFGLEDLSDVIMVGDSHYDIEAGHNAGVQTVAVNWSLKGLTYLQKYNPTYIIDDMRELLPIAGVTEA
ncbi:pyrophosphatase PpaX [Paenibacillus sp. N1-5-1-14]|uniref:pyrophosphatase PpaX n=1 Tax=Paenibacillus radicibacter TaxID=2972488 RepID=UPI0021599916|nr:pyrophosphatase PpaX [Paenibacillus radicibacter]MCR8643327.1 pyrophosphatase PpaX [Paenibacillus radicibacter]